MSFQKGQETPEIQKSRAGHECKCPAWSKASAAPRFLWNHDFGGKFVRLVIKQAASRLKQQQHLKIITSHKVVQQHKSNSEWMT